MIPILVFCGAFPWSLDFFSELQTHHLFNSSIWVPKMQLKTNTGKREFILTMNLSLLRFPSSVNDIIIYQVLSWNESAVANFLTLHHLLKVQNPGRESNWPCSENVPTPWQEERVK